MQIYDFMSACAKKKYFLEKIVANNYGFSVGNHIT